MRWGISTRKARRLRAMVTQTIAMRRNLDERLLEKRKRMAAENVARLKEQLSPGYRINLQRALAQWEAHVDSLEDDGVYAIPKGRE